MTDMSASKPPASPDLIGVQMCTAATVLATVMMIMVGCASEPAAPTTGQGVPVWGGVPDTTSNTDDAKGTSGDKDAETKDVAATDTAAPDVAQDTGPVDTGPELLGCGKASACIKYKDTPYCDLPNQVCVECLNQFHCNKKADADWEEAKKKDKNAEKPEYQCADK